MNLTEQKAFAKELDQKYKDEFEDISKFIFEHPELGMEEYESAKYLVEYMQKKGFEVEIPCCGMDTAFSAKKGSKGPRVAFLAEYDALPGYGPDLVNGHACGHNWIAAVTAASSVILSEVCEKAGIEAQVYLVGTPAEETYGGKVLMVNEGYFNDFDLCLQAHLAEHNSITSYALALTTLIFTFKGKASHSSAAPWNGVNALDAVQLMFAGINALRQHVKPEVRIHGIITEGGQAHNIVPDKASCVITTRSLTRKYTNELVEKVKNIARGAELMTGAKLEIDSDELPLDDLVHIPTLQKLADENLRANGIIPNLTPEKAKLQAGSSDIGNVSAVCPTMYIEVMLDGDVEFNCHEEVCLTQADSESAHVRLHQVALTLTGIALDCLDSPDLIEKSKAELQAQI